MSHASESWYGLEVGHRDLLRGVIQEQRAHRRSLPRAGRPSPRAWLASAALALIAGLLLTGCFGDDRSVAAVCQVWDHDGLALHNQFSQIGGQAQQNLFGALTQVASAPVQVGDLMAKMAAVAPTNVAPAFQQVADAVKDHGNSPDVITVFPHL
jgi:hypothetical protein